MDLYLPPKPAIIIPRPKGQVYSAHRRGILMVNPLVGFGAAPPAGGGGGGVGNDEYTKILLHFDGTHGSTTITDDNAGGSAHTWTATGSSISTTESKFGGASLDCGASAGYVTTPDHADFTLGTSDFTVDFWFNRQGYGTPQYPFLHAGSGGATNWGVVGEFISINDKLQCYVRSGSSAEGHCRSTSVFNATGWHHVAYVRSGSNFYLFIDGVEEATATGSGSVNDSSGSFAVGCRADTLGSIFNGYLEEFRLSVGIARWTSGFTPPTAAYG